jgi:hypothetical protein
MSDDKIKRPSTGLLFLVDNGMDSPHKMTLVRLVMKGIRISHEDLWKSLNTLPKEKLMNWATFEQTLRELVEEEWLWRVELDGKTIYSPRLKTSEGKPR